MYVSLSLDTISENRRIYGIFDLCADIGGLLDIFQIFAQKVFVVLTWLIGSDFEFFLISRIFKRKLKRTSQSYDMKSGHQN